jgi:hypothetical protein
MTNQTNGGLTTTALTDFLELATISTSSPSETPLIYPIPIPTFSKLGAGAPEDRRPITLPFKSVTTLPGRGNGTLSTYFIPHLLRNEKSPYLYQ